MKIMNKSVLLVLCLLVTMIVPADLATEPVAQAQQNLLTNPSFDTGWYGQEGVDGQVANGWTMWGRGQKPAVDRYVFLPWVRSAPSAWVMRGGYVAWTAGAYQKVTVERGSTYRFTIQAFVYTCDDLATSCYGDDGRVSNTDYNSRVRVGIDPIGAENPNADRIVWSAYTSPYDAYGAVTVEAVADRDEITVYFENTVNQPPPALRETYWDDALLVKIGEGDGSSGGSDPDPPPPAVVPFVQPQNARANGSLIHRVRQGDTFNSIYVAYRALGVTRDSILELNDWELPPAIITIGQEIVILPPGSVDPETGEVLRLAGEEPAATPPPASGGSEDPAPPPSTPEPPSGPSAPSSDPDVEKGGSLPEFPKVA